MLMLLILGSVSFGQATASLATDPATTASPGETVVVPLMVTNFNNVGAITFQISYLPGVLDYVNFTPAVLPNNFIVNASGSRIIITWTANPPTYPTFNGKLLDLNFVYTGPGLCPLNFIPTQCEVVNGSLGNINVTYTNGSVDQDLSITTKAKLVGGTATTGAETVVVLQFEDFVDSVGAITQKIHYDASKLDFISAEGKGRLAGAIGNASGSVITVVWTKVTGADINWTSAKPGNKILLHFVYTGNTETDVEFYPGCIISTATDPANNIKVSYHKGMVEPGAPVASAALGSQLNAEQGMEYDIPLTLLGLDALYLNTASAITLNILYESSKLSFIGASSNPHGALINASGSVLSIVWTDPAPGILDGEFLKLRFRYDGVGEAYVKFGSGCLFSTVTGDPIQVSYTDGKFKQGGSSHAYIGMPGGAIGDNVAVPVKFTDMPADVGAVTLYILFDVTKLSCLSVTDFPSDGSANFNITGNLISIVWTSPTPWANINIDDFCKLNFHVNGNGPAPITFDYGCEVANNHMPLPDIVPTIWHDGGINLGYKVSGFLTYNNEAGTNFLDGVTVYLKNGQEPYPLNTPAPTIFATTTTDATGYFEFTAPDGVYYIYASTTRPWTCVNGGDIIQMQRYIAGMNPNTIGTTPPPPWSLRHKAANVIQNNVINGGDVIAAQRRYLGMTSPYYSAADWLFENPSVTVAGGDVMQNFKANISGDVNGSYPCGGR